MAASPPEAPSSELASHDPENVLVSRASTKRAAWIGVGAAVLGSMVLVLAGWSAMRASASRCGEGFRVVGARCCGEGQSLEGAHCTGKPAQCGNTLIVTNDGCVATSTVIALPGGSLHAAAADWEVDGKTAPPGTTIGAFRIDAFEVTWARYADCVSSGKCARLSPTGEPGQPVTRITAFEAARFCGFAGGSLPSVAQFSFAAAGSEGRRYPWGPSGAVCRRAAWGIVEGPCANGSSEPDVTGSHPDGDTPEGIHDLAGNVAEWTVPRPDGLAAITGGSFRDREASALKTSSTRVLAADQSSDDVGFRCAYRAEKP